MDRRESFILQHQSTIFKTLNETQSLTSDKVATLCAQYASDKKAEDILVLDLRGISTFTDFFVICSGTSEPHLKAISNEIQDKMRTEHNARPYAVDGYPTSQWIIVDFNDVLIHIFHKDKRGYYGLEDLWSDAPRVKVV